MKTILLFALLSQDESIAEKAKRLAADPKANHDALLRLGAPAIRPLLEVRRAELEPLIDELRFAYGGEAVLKKFGDPASIKVSDIVAAGALKLLLAPKGVTLYIDPAAQKALDAARVTIDFQNKPLGEAVREICAKAGVEYGYARGRLILAAPDRLWPLAPARVKPLTDDQAAQLRKAAALLGDDSLEVRDQAARDLLALGAAAIPHLEKLLANGNTEQQAQIRTLVAKLVPRPAWPVFLDKLAIESQELDDAGRKALAALGKNITFKVRLCSLALTFKLLFMQVSLEMSVVSGGEIVVSYEGEDQSLIDMLYWLAVPNDLDAYWAEGKIVIDSRANVAEAVGKK